MRVIGTAGHVDHGKSALVEALTGTHPDRLAEEQRREMTIDLGFAFMTLPDGQGLGIVDVPGHRDFIENMLAGVGGMDAVLFVVAADEGMMPQSREHLAILNILRVSGGVIVLTKCDLVSDPGWLDLVEEDIRAAVGGTVLADAPLVRVSARKKQGLDVLIRELQGVLEKTPLRPDLGRARISVDRVFSMAGFGSVATGTLLDGRLAVGNEVEILPAGTHARIRGLQVRRQSVESAYPGSRVAVNLAGLAVDEIRRGDVISLPGRYQPSTRVDVYFEMTRDARAELTHNSEVKVFCGAAETSARVRLLGAEKLTAGQSGWLQLELRDPLVMVRGDRYILRLPSPPETLGGGMVVDAHPDQRHKRFAPEVLERLESLRNGTPEEIVFLAVAKLGPVRLQILREAVRMAEPLLTEMLAELVESGQVVKLDEERGAAVYLSAAVWQTETDKALAELTAFHKSNPLRSGLARETLKSRGRVLQPVFSAALQRWVQMGWMREEAGLVAHADFQPRLSAVQQALADQLLTRFSAAPYNPPSVKECQQEAGEEVYRFLLAQGRLVQVSAEVVFTAEVLESMRSAVQAHFETHDTLAVTEFRDQFQTSRKYALAFLEYLDQNRVTIRVGDVRRLL